MRTTIIKLLLPLALGGFFLAALILIRRAGAQEVQPYEEGPYEAAITEIAWAGTHASSNDEWFEVSAVDITGVNTDGWTLTITRTNGVTNTIRLPGVDVGVSETAVFERTDDTTMRRVADGIYAGALVNTDVGEVALRDSTGRLQHLLVFQLGEWPFGSNETKASMEYANGQWRTATQVGGVDAACGEILGSPGYVSPNPAEDWDGCGSRVFLARVEK